MHAMRASENFLRRIDKDKIEAIEKSARLLATDAFG
jgi:hypothetical protein